MSARKLMGICAGLLVAGALLFMFGGWRLSLSDFAYSDGGRVWSTWPATFDSYDECRSAGTVVRHSAARETVTACVPAWIPAALIVWVRRTDDGDGGRIRPRR